MIPNPDWQPQSQAAPWPVQHKILTCEPPPPEQRTEATPPSPSAIHSRASSNSQNTSIRNHEAPDRASPLFLDNRRSQHSLTQLLGIPSSGRTSTTRLGYEFGHCQLDKYGLRQTFKQPRKARRYQHKVEPPPQPDRFCQFLFTCEVTVTEKTRATTSKTPLRPFRLLWLTKGSDRVARARSVVTRLSGPDTWKRQSAQPASAV